MIVTCLELILPPVNTIFEQVNCNLHNTATYIGDYEFLNSPHLEKLKEKSSRPRKKKAKKGSQSGDCEQFIHPNTIPHYYPLAQFILETDHPSRQIIRQDGSSVQYKYGTSYMIGRSPAVSIQSRFDTSHFNTNRSRFDTHAKSFHFHELQYENLT